MNSSDKKTTELRLNKIMMIASCFVILMLIIAGAYFFNRNTNKAETSSEVTTTTPPIITDTTVEETTTPEETTNIIETTTPPETTVPETTISDPPVIGSYLTLTESERLILATLIRLECGGSSYETQMAVASVVINRMNLWGLSLRQAVFQKNVFSPARLIDENTGYSYYNPPKTGTYAQCWQVVDDICANGPTLPYYVIYFRSGHYHSWATPYKKIGSLYFSYAEKYK